ncbi:ABC transporter substrate-binding protein [Bradyrhizobium sp. BWA-3-5]|uniref:ABC transporter substrate-binding protein n=1 Tax=Bradyrhizobium sp. BWA-3-5 TaxID=3080013 RepID=UPI00293E824A|nr:ABC transporter substrate-binding protein [Bradyrhizobium sp. BWA-3-5]WOH69831.1 ABC transporter substrate-binding protein [Bradyrhizobium sp. BWA-3-5]
MLAAIAAPGLTDQAGAAPGDNEIRIGNTMPYTGPASAYGVIGKVLAAYFDKVNAEGGIRGRKINFISYDDAYNPTKTMEATRKLVEEDNVLFIFASLGTNTSQAVHPYLNSRKIPQLFVASGATMWDQPREFPWTMGFLPSYQTESHIYSQYILENHPRSKIAVLYQDDGFGKDYLKGIKDGLGGKVPIVAEASYKVTDTNIDAQIAKLKASGADIFMQFTTPKFATMAIKRNAEVGWKPIHFLASVSESVSSVMVPAGVENAEGIISAMYRLEGEDAQAAGPAVFREWSAFMERYVPSVSKSNGQAVYGYLNARLIVEVLKMCGDDFSRENIMKQARSIKGLQIPMMVPGILINTSPSDHATIEQMRLMRFTNGHWQFFGPVRSGIDPGTVSDSFKTLFKYGTATKRDLANQLNANTVSLMTGSFGSTYAQVGADLASVLDNGTNLRILPVMGRGSVQAVADILLLRGVDAGIVRKDTLAYLDRKDFAKDIRNQFVYVAKMFNEEMHVLAPRTIANVRDLDGKTVVVDLPDSSTFVTAINVFERLGIRPHLVYQEPRLAVDMLRKGEVDAIVAIEGKPVQWLNQITDRNLHLVPLEYAKNLQEEYLPSKLSSQDYPNLVADGSSVETISAEAVLASYNWAPNSDRYRRLALLVDTMFDKVAQLQRPPFHPKWKEMAPRATVAGWTRFKAAQEWLDRNMPASASVSAASGAVPPPAAATLSPQERDPLYREFLEWRAQRAKAAGSR